MSKRKAFSKPHDPNWIPAKGTKVYLPQRSPFRLSMCGRVDQYDPEWKTVQVTYSVNRRLKTIWLKIEEVRPTPPRFNKVRDQ